MRSKIFKGMCTWRLTGEGKRLATRCFTWEHTSRTLRRREFLIKSAQLAELLFQHMMGNVQHERLAKEHPPGSRQLWWERRRQAEAPAKSWAGIAYCLLKVSCSFSSLTRSLLLLPEVERSGGWFVLQKWEWNPLVPVYKKQANT